MKYFFGLVVALSFLLGGYLVMTMARPTRSTQPVATVTSADNVSVEDGKQIVELRAKGGYLPKVSLAKSGLPTVLRIDTAGTFDCSSSVRIPSLNVSQTLPATGVTDISLGALAKGTFQGTCSMGMYPFQIEVTD